MLHFSVCILLLFLPSNISVVIITWALFKDIVEDRCNKLKSLFPKWDKSLLVLLRKTGFFDGIYNTSMGKQDLNQDKMYLCDLSRSKFHSVTSSHVILYNDVKNLILAKVDLSGFGNELFNCWIMLNNLCCIMMLTWINKQPRMQKFWDWCSHYQEIYGWISWLIVINSQADL